MAKEKKTTLAKSQTSKTMEPMVFGKKNYLLLIVSAVIVIIGFLLMTGNDGDVVDVKSRQLTIAPIVVMLGFGLAIYSVIAKSPEDKSESEE
ncbi:MAG: DUF3098 domain-containing protein [Bacteroidetes bacterium]|jgi:NADH:ubiquinone oxidoreductase subunit 6 (subunit J)|nr:DUF3098 domain-containing protein [Bacteroidota bacterium]